ncbi:hypothetical protein PV396_24600 [Streptomyces sp. ME02-8801-2C]|uniref:hypothetical protein n=1 Tax=Streptomyces sp. ME02-8801-2C TaxID=3028680 RepID=UPI0029B3C0C3|nr:hypothetical protein [Streptomyces sp. ME02-8801-2C]MDX3455083.1 hypothetical protein [Streptomyces sp. ME02-8801-2C]
MTFSFELPPERLTWYHLGSLLAAEAGRLTYDRGQYSVHGVSNNAIACHWAGLLVDGDGGMVLTGLGRTMLADWKASPDGQAWLLAERSDDEHDQEQHAATQQPAPTVAEQLDLFGVAS